MRTTASTRPRAVACASATAAALVSLPTAGHVLTGGALPSIPLLAMALVVAAAVSAAARSRSRILVGAAAVGAMQVFLHQVCRAVESLCSPSLRGDSGAPALLHNTGEVAACVTRADGFDTAVLLTNVLGLAVAALLSGLLDRLPVASRARRISALLRAAAAVQLVATKARVSRQSVLILPRQETVRHAALRRGPPAPAVLS